MKLSPKERDAIKSHALSDLEALFNAARQSAEQHWQDAEMELIQELQLNDVVTRLGEIGDEIARLHQERVELRARVPGKGHDLTPNELEQAGFARAERRQGTSIAALTFDADYTGHVSQYPRIFNQQVRTEWDARVFERLCEKVGFKDVIRVLQNVAQATMRSIDRAATFEEVNQDYDALLGLVKRAAGDNAPLLLDEVVERADRLLLPPSSETEDAEAGGKGAA